MQSNLIQSALKPEHQIMLDWVERGSCVLDLGCADGALLEALMREKAISGYGLEIDRECINAAIKRGVSVIEADLEVGLRDFEDDSVDTVILGNTLQTVRNTEALVEEAMRVGRHLIVSFPNFGYWRVRGYLSLYGQMPVSKSLPFEWYNTPNIHLFTVQDFYRLCRAKHMQITDASFLVGEQVNPILAKWQPNIFAEFAVFRVSPIAS